MKLRNFLPLCLIVAFVAILHLSCSTSAKLPTADSFLTAVTQQKDATSYLMMIQSAGGLASVLGKEKYTLLVPVDSAFSRLGFETLMDLMSPSNTAVSTNLLKEHIAKGTFSPEQLAKVAGISNLNGKTFNVSNGGAQIAGAKVMKTVKTKEGYVYFLDAVIKE